MIYDNSRDALAHIVRECGEEVLLGSSLKSLLADYAPGIEARRKNMIGFVYSSGAAEILKRNLSAGEREKELAFRQAVRQMVDTYATDSELTESVMLEFSEALGWKVKDRTKEKEAERKRQEEEEQRRKQEQEKQRQEQERQEQELEQQRKEQERQKQELERQRQDLERQKREQEEQKTQWSLRQRQRKQEQAVKHIFKAASAIVLVAVLVAAVFGVSSSLSRGKADKVSQMIANLPDSITDYSYYEQEIGNAYAAYMELDLKQQSRVVNSEKLLANMDGYNAYQVGVIRRTLEEVSPESVQNTDVLERLAQLSGKVSNEQRAMLTQDENRALEQLTCVYATVRGIKDLMGDIVGKYDTLPEIKKNYARVAENYRELVYNAAELDTIEEKYQLQTALVFSEGDGGWAVSVNPDSRDSLSGDIVIPSEYQGNPVKTIPEGAFNGCAKIRSVTVPDSVTGIGYGAFGGCIGLQSITLPFVGAGRDASESTYSWHAGHFGYIFGNDSYSGGMEVRQCFLQYGSYNSTNRYYIPNQLRSVTITDAVQLSDGAFSGCSMLSDLTINSAARSSVGERAFEGCVKPAWN